MVQAYTRVEEWNWTFQVSVHRSHGMAGVPNAPGAFRLFWIVEGDVEVATDGGIVRAAGPGLLCAGSRERIDPIRDDAQVRAVVFHPGALNDAFGTNDVYNLDAFQGTTRSDQYYLHPFLRQAGHPLTVAELPLALVDRLQYLFDRMETELRFRSDRFWPCRTRSLLLEALILARQGPGPVPRSGLVDRVLSHLHTHYSEPFTLPQLAAKFATNRTTLAERFRLQTGVSVGDYVRALRIRVAGVLLRDTTLPVSEILERVGFTDPSHFGRLFRRETGVSPTEYRQRNNWILQTAS